MLGCVEGVGGAQQRPLQAQVVGAPGLVGLGQPGPGVVVERAVGPGDAAVATAAASSPSTRCCSARPTTRRHTS